MKHLIIILSSLLVFTGLRAQQSPGSTAALARQIQRYYNNPTDRIRAAYTWVANNIRYSTEGTLAMNHGPDKRSVIDVSFAKRRGVCENFAAIFTDVCQKMGIRSVVIEGYTTVNPHADNGGHSWSAVYINNDWYLFDPTWDAGKSANFDYFMKPGRDFITTHVPFDPMWQMLEHPLTENNRTYSALFNYRDSIDCYLSSDSLNRYESATVRIENKKLKNRLTDTHLKVLKNELEIQRQDRQMQWYNQAVDYLNRATDGLNQFIDFRNLQFATIKSEENLMEILEGVDQNLDAASGCLEQVDKSKAVLVYGTEPAKEQLEILRKKYWDQKRYLKEYLQHSTSKN